MDVDKKRKVSEDEAEADRKEQKRLKKLAKKAKEDREVETEPAEESTEETEEEKKARKAAKKAAKKAKDEPETVEEPVEKVSKKDRKEKPAVFVPPPNLNVPTVATDVAVQVYPEEAATEFPAFKSFEEMYAVIKKDPKNSGSVLNTIKNYISSKGFPKPSPIQSHCWPALFSNKDLVGIASTGSGKTLAFLFPAIFRLEQMKLAGKFPSEKKPSPKILVVAPTRELAMQSYQVCVDVGIVSSICVYGGVSKHGQLSDMRKLTQQHSGLDIVIATPGRLLDFISESSISLSQTFYLVLDEADRMLDEGFEPAIRQIIGQCPDKDHRQTAMLSATWPEEIRALANNYLKVDDTIRVVVGSEELAANHRVTQIVEVVENDARVKDTKLFQLLDKYHKPSNAKCLIFVLYKVEAVKLQQTLEKRGYNVTAIHGNKTQVDRTEALATFRNGSVPLLIATDVAARGLDIPNVEYVINYSFPLTVEDYVHRIGRTGRGGKTGVSHTFFTDFDKALAGGLVGVLQEANQAVPQEIYRFPMLTKKKESKLYGAFGPKTDIAGKKATKITFD